MNILFLAANPVALTHLDLEQEQRSLELQLSAVRYRDQITFVSKFAATPDDLVRHVREEKPTVVHFSGHGTANGIVLRNDDGGYQPVPGESLRRFFTGRGIDLVVLSSCASQPQVVALSSAVSMIIGTNGALDDEAARRFSVAFYRTLGNGDTVAEAYRDGRDAVVLYDKPDVFVSQGMLDRRLCAAAPPNPR